MPAKARLGCSAQPELPEELSAPQIDAQHMFWGGKLIFPVFFLMEESLHRFWLCYSPATGNSLPLYTATQRAFCGGWDGGTGGGRGSLENGLLLPGRGCRAAAAPRGTRRRREEEKGLNH